jgi:hypothetical protein
MGRLRPPGRRPRRRNGSGQGSLRLPQRDLGAGGRREQASPAGWPLSRLEQHGRAQQARALGGLCDVGNLDVRQSRRALALVLYRAALKPLRRARARGRSSRSRGSSPPSSGRAACRRRTPGAGCRSEAPDARRGWRSPRSSPVLFDRRRRRNSPAIGQSARFRRSNLVSYVCRIRRRRVAYPRGRPRR